MKPATVERPTPSPAAGPTPGAPRPPARPTAEFAAVLADAAGPPSVHGTLAEAESAGRSARAARVTTVVGAGDRTKATTARAEAELGTDPTADIAEKSAEELRTRGELPRSGVDPAMAPQAPAAARVPERAAEPRHPDGGDAKPVLDGKMDGNRTPDRHAQGTTNESEQEPGGLQGKTGADGAGVPHPGPSSPAGERRAGTPATAMPAMHGGGTAVERSAPAGFSKASAADGLTAPTPARGGVRDALKPLLEQGRPGAESREAAQVVAQAARGLAAALRSGDDTVTLRLNPGDLGQLTVEVSMGDEGITARFQPTTDAAHRLLSGSVEDLRAALEARGLRVERVEIGPQPVVQDAVPEGRAADSGTGATTGRESREHSGSHPEGGWGDRGRGEGGVAAGAGDEPIWAAGVAASPITLVSDGRAGYRLRLDATA